MAAHSSTDAGDPVKIGGKSRATFGTSVSAGEATDAAFTVQIATGTGIALTAGYVSWILRGGALAAMLFVTMLLPQLDPLPRYHLAKQVRTQKVGPWKNRDKSLIAPLQAQAA